MPPTGGATRVIVRPARKSPIAWTVSRSGPFTSFAVGTPDAAIGEPGHGGENAGAHAQ